MTIKSGLSLISSNQFSEAYQVFQKILVQNNRSLPDILIPLYRELITNIDNPDLKLIIAKLYYHQGYFNDVIDEIDEILAIDPKCSDAYLMLSKLYFKHSEKNLIRNYFESAFIQQIYDPVVIDFLPKIYLDQQDIDRHIWFYCTWLSSHPNDTVFQKPLAKLYEQKGAILLAAKTYFQMAIQSPILLPDSIASLVTIIDSNRYSSDIRVLLIELYYQALNPTEASNHLTLLVDLDSNQIDTAIKWYLFGLDRFPDMPILLNGLAMLYSSKRLYSDAVVQYEKLINLNYQSKLDISKKLIQILNECPNQLMARTLLIRIFIETNYLEKACTHIEYAIHHQDEDLDTVLDMINQILTKDATLYRAIYLKASLLIKQTYYDDSLLFINQLVETELASQAYLLKASMRLKQKDYKDAIRAAHDSLSADPYFSDTHKFLKSLMNVILKEEIESVTQSAKKATSYYQLGLLHLRNQNYMESISAFQSISSIKRFHLKTTLMIGRCFMEMGRYDLAIDQFSGIVKLNSLPAQDTNDILFLIGICQANSGHLIEAQQSFNQILKTNIHYNGLQSVLDQLAQRHISDHVPKGLSLIGNWTNDSLHSVDLITLTPIESQPKKRKHHPHTTLSFSTPHNNQGITFLLEKNFISAENEFQTAAQLEERSAIPLVNLAISFIVQRNLEAAQSLLEKAKSIDKSLDMIFLTYGFIEMINKNFIAAADHFNAVITQSSSHRIAQLNLGDCLYHLNHLEKAFYYWDLAALDQTLRHFVTRRRRYLERRSLGYSYWMK